jgi:hypothetical protein
MNKDEIIKDPNCIHDWNVHNDIGMDMVYCTKCESVKRDQLLALKIFHEMCEKDDINQ